MCSITKEKDLKYKAKKTVIDGHKFDSRLEARHYTELKYAVLGGIISELEIQPRFELQPAFDKGGKHYRKIEYVADFKYKINKTGEIIIQDSKGFKTAVYELKKKMFEYKYPDLTIKEVN